MTPLTARQQQLLDYLEACELCPSFTEMRDALGLTSKSGVHRLIAALEERGFVRRLRYRARAIELTGRTVSASTLPTVAEANELYNTRGIVVLPLYGRIS